jgi:anaerobic ribonucleoside-triphosphate reductase activating protein
LKIAGIVKDSVVDGPGLRTTIFMQGCPHHCNGCHNPDTWDYNGGGTEMTLEEIWNEVMSSSKLIKGITISGGEPFLQVNDVLNLVDLAIDNLLDVVIYTGYTLEELIAMSDKQPRIITILLFTDLLIDGRFIEEQRDISLPFRGSKNQRLIRSNSTIITGSLKLWDPSKEDFYD